MSFKDSLATNIAGLKGSLAEKYSSMKEAAGTGIETRLEIAFANQKDRALECFQRLMQKNIFLYTHATGKVLSEKDLENFKINISHKDYSLLTNPINFCKEKFEAQGLTVTYKFPESKIDSLIVKDDNVKLHSIGTAKKTDGSQIQGCKYLVAGNISNLVEKSHSIDVSALGIKDVNDLTIENIKMNNFNSIAVSVRGKELAPLVCLYDYQEKLSPENFRFVPNSEAARCYNKLAKDGISLWDSNHNKKVTLEDAEAIKLKAPAMTEVKKYAYYQYSYKEWCQSAFQETGIHSYYELDTKPIAVKPNGKTYSIGKAYKNKSLIDGCGYVIDKAASSKEHLIDISALKVNFADLIFEKMIMNDKPTSAVIVHNVQPKYLVCLYDYHEELAPSLFKFAETE